MTVNALFRVKKEKQLCSLKMRHYMEQTEKYRNKNSMENTLYKRLIRDNYFCCWKQHLKDYKEN